ncbi:NAD(P)/FAD-dependent oxidoreductase [Thermus oshimai]|uniref:NAD(P)/FAD-dependent oxidoreductase n=1 Tax=Thermus oshimai TaxID=56957 RepID=UPI0003A567A5|nr:FAD-dependent oxidoreductase [Thermus oshimai]
MPDAIVVGAGIVGAASAYRLAEAGLRVLLLEKEAAFAQGSTGRSAAGVRVQFSEPVNVLLSYRSILEYRALPEARYRPIGYLFLVPEALAGAQEEALRTQTALGVPVRRLSLEEAEGLVPFRKEGLAFATFGPLDGVIDPHGATAFYLQRARALGAEVRFAEPVVGAERVGRGFRVYTPKGAHEAPLVLLATGAWTGAVGRLFGVDLPVWPLRRMVFATAPTPFPHAFPLTVDLGTGFYLRSEGPRLLLGRSNPEERPGFLEGMDWGWLGPTLEAGLARFPFLEEAALDPKPSPCIRPAGGQGIAPHTRQKDLPPSPDRTSTIPPISWGESRFFRTPKGGLAAPRCLANKTPTEGGSLRWRAPPLREAYGSAPHRVRPTGHGLPYLRVHGEAGGVVRVQGQHVLGGERGCGGKLNRVPIPVRRVAQEAGEVREGVRGGASQPTLGEKGFVDEVGALQADAVALEVGGRIAQPGHLGVGVAVHGEATRGPGVGKGYRGVPRGEALVGVKTPGSPFPGHSPGDVPVARGEALHGTVGDGGSVASAQEPPSLVVPAQVAHEVALARGGKP